MFRLAGVLLVLVFIYQLVTQTEVAPDITARDEDSSSSKRTLFNIIWGCVSTTIICAWAAIHPNIPPREGPFKRTLRRLELMFWTIVAPEILPCWAMNQLLGAITVRDVYNEGKGYTTKRCGIWETVKIWFSLHEIKVAPSPAWTVAHGHFLIMGGFHVVEPPIRSTGANTDTQSAADPPPTSTLADADTEKAQGPSSLQKELGSEPEQGRVTILTLGMLRKLVKDPGFEIRTTEVEISDKSKGDALSKLIFIMQSTWFILQCVGRRVQGLNLTHLELTTLALASLNGITFILWWDKPLGAQAAVPIYMNRKLKDSERLPVSYRSARSDVVEVLQKSLEACVAIIRDAFRCQSTMNIFVLWLVLLPLAILFVLLFPIIAFTFAFFATLNDLVERTSSSFPPDETSVPTFYVPKHRYPKWYHILLLVTLGAVFGGIHCSGWNFIFPTHAEQKLWRVASLAVTIIPIASFPFAIMVSIDGSSTIESLAVVSGGLTFVLCALAYVSARLVLLGLALSLLRHLPPTAFVAINWTRFYPHFL